MPSIKDHRVVPQDVARAGPRNASHLSCLKTAAEPVTANNLHQFVIDPSGLKYVCARKVTGSVTSITCVRCL